MIDPGQFVVKPYTPAPDPNQAMSEAFQALGANKQRSFEQQQQDQRLAQQDKQFQQEQGLRVNDQLLKGQSQAHGEDQTAAGMLLKYNEFLANGDDASAASMAPALKALGMDLKPVGQGTPGQSPHEFHAQMTGQAAPEEKMPALGGAGAMHLDKSLAPSVPKGAARPFAPGEYVNNPDKSWSSERTMTVTHPGLNNGAATNIPSVWIKDGKPYEAKSEDEAVQLAIASGLGFKSYGDLPEADKASVDRESSWQGLKNPRDARKVEALYANERAKGKPIPPLLTKFMAAQGGQTAPAPSAAPGNGKPIPPLLTKFMAAQGALPGNVADEGPAAAAERIRSIGGTPPEMRALPEEQPSVTRQPADQLGPIDVEGHNEPLPAPGPVTPPALSQAQASGGLPSYEVTYRGKSLGVIDPNLFHRQGKEAATRIGQGFVDSLPESVGQQFEQGLQPAANAGEQNKAVDRDMQILLQGMRSDAMKRHGGGSGVAGGFPVGKEAHALQTEIRTTMQAAATDQKVADSNKTLNNISQGLAGLQEGGSVAERGAVAQLIKSSFPGALSDQERNYITEANGIQGKLANMLGYWVESGHMDPNLIAQVKRLQEISSRITQERLGSAATEVAESWGRIHPELSPQAREAYIQEGISLHSPTAATKRRDAVSGKVPERPSFLK